MPPKLFSLKNDNSDPMPSHPLLPLEKILSSYRPAQPSYASKRPIVLQPPSTSAAQLPELKRIGLELSTAVASYRSTGLTLTNNELTQQLINLASQGSLTWRFLKDLMEAELPSLTSSEEPSITILRNLSSFLHDTYCNLQVFCEKLIERTHAIKLELPHSAFVQALDGIGEELAKFSTENHEAVFGIAYKFLLHAILSAIIAKITNYIDKNKEAISNNSNLPDTISPEYYEEKVLPLLRTLQSRQVATIEELKEAVEVLADNREASSRNNAIKAQVRVCFGSTEKFLSDYLGNFYRLPRPSSLAIVTKLTQVQRSYQLMIESHGPISSSCLMISGMGPRL